VKIGEVRLSLIESGGVRIFPVYIYGESLRQLVELQVGIMGEHHA
jgi:hypothetical protein